MPAVVISGEGVRGNKFLMMVQLDLLQKPETGEPCNYFKRE